MSNHNRLHNQNYIGPGLWYGMHLDAAWATTPDKKVCVIGKIKNLQAKFPCGECKVHFGDYIQSHPLEPTINADEEALFRWTFNFHNAVNARLKKPQVSYDDAKKIFYEDSAYCSADCDETPKRTPPRLIPKDMPGYVY